MRKGSNNRTYRTKSGSPVGRALANVSAIGSVNSGVPVMFSYRRTGQHHSDCSS